MHDVTIDMLLKETLLRTWIQDCVVQYILLSGVKKGLSRAPPDIEYFKILVPTWIMFFDQNNDTGGSHPASSNSPGACSTSARSCRTVRLSRICLSVAPDTCVSMFAVGVYMSLHVCFFANFSQYCAMLRSTEHPYAQGSTSRRPNDTKGKEKTIKL